MTHPQVGTNKSHRTHRHTFRICSSSPRSHAPHTSKHQPSTHTPPFPVPFVCCCRHDAAAWWLCHRVACQAMPHVGSLRVDTACLPGHHRTPAGSPVPTTLLQQCRAAATSTTCCCFCCLSHAAADAPAATAAAAAAAAASPSQWPRAQTRMLLQPSRGTAAPAVATPPPPLNGIPAAPVLWPPAQVAARHGHEP